MKHAEFGMAALLLAASIYLGSAIAQTTDQPLTDGPVTVTADEAEWRREGVMLYQGNVRLVSGGMELRGQRMELRQIRQGRYKAFLSGGPATLKHQADAADDQPVSAQASSIIYDSGTGELELEGAVELPRGADRLTSDNMRYDLPARRIKAAGGSGGQVRITIQPPKNDETPAEPAPQVPE